MTFQETSCCYGNRSDKDNYNLFLANVTFINKYKYNFKKFRVLIKNRDEVFLIESLE